MNIMLEKPLWDAVHYELEALVLRFLGPLSLPGSVGSSCEIAGSWAVNGSVGGHHLGENSFNDVAGWAEDVVLGCLLYCHLDSNSNISYDGVMVMLVAT